MDIDWVIMLGDALLLGGAVVLLIGLLTTAHPIVRIGLGSRRRAITAALVGVVIASGGFSVIDYRCNPTIPCGHCSAFSRSLDEQSCLPLITATRARDAGPTD
jgi:hypothetical protein